jgi:hypothetical protein
LTHTEPFSCYNSITPIQVTRLTEGDIDGVVTCIQQAFAEDPYNLWVYNDRSKVGAFLLRVICLIAKTHNFTVRQSLPNPVYRPKIECPHRSDGQALLPHLDITGLTWYLQIDLTRNRMSLGIRCRWGIRNGLFFVAKEAGSDLILGTAMWLPPRPLNQKQNWSEWLWEQWEGWRLWGNQVGMNLWYGRGGLNVKVRMHICTWKILKPRERYI